VFWPFLDRKGERDIRKRPLLLASTVLAVAAVVALTVWGKVS
jgi:quinol-cytochrome oxidoreductase complex cytochrome b subunit